LDAASVDARADLWSLAVVAYQCLTGRLPYPGKTLAAVCLALRVGCHIPPTKFRSDLPRALDAWFERAFARSIEQRFATVEELAGAWIAALPATTAQYRLRRPSRTQDAVCV
jgi:serine/threonine-protein kinase